MNLQLHIVTKDFPDMDRLDELALEAFPPEEYLAPCDIIEISKKFDMDFWAIYDNNDFIGFTVIARYKTMVYLFFLAITPENRSKGYGTKIISLISANYKSCQFVVDFEMIDESASNIEQRIKRKEFYLRNGFKETDKFLTYFGVSYEILCMHHEFDFSLFKKLMNALPIDGLAPVYFTK